MTSHVYAGGSPLSLTSWMSAARDYVKDQTSAKRQFGIDLLRSIAKQAKELKLMASMSDDTLRRRIFRNKGLQVFADYKNGRIDLVELPKKLWEHISADGETAYEVYLMYATYFFLGVIALHGVSALTRKVFNAVVRSLPPRVQQAAVVANAAKSPAKKSPQQVAKSPAKKSPQKSSPSRSPAKR
jgi:hypothetical protein